MKTLPLLHPRALLATVLLLATAASPPAARAQAARQNYAFTNVADDSGRFAGFENSAVNADGTVSFKASLKAGGAGIFRFDANGTLLTIADTTGAFGFRFTGFGTSAFVNAFGDVSFNGTLPDGHDGVFYGDGTKIVSVQETAYQGYSSPTINANKALAYVSYAPRFNAAPEPYILRSNAPGAIPQIIAGPGATYRGFGTPSTFASFEPPAINEAGTLTFRAGLADGRQGIFLGRGNGDPFLAAVTGGAFQSFGQVPGITDGDIITFHAVGAAGNQVIHRYTPTTGNLETIVDTADGRFEQLLTRPSINAALTVAFAGVRKAGPAGIYTGADPATGAVIEQGAPLFGSTLNEVGTAPGALGDRGHIVFAYVLADGRRGLALATPASNAPPSPGDATVSVSVDLPKVSRGAGQVAVVTFTRAGADLSGQLEVAFTLDGTLIGGSDYAALSGVRKIKAGKSSASLTIAPLPGGANGKLNLRLAPGEGYAVGSPNKVKVKIVD